MATSLLPRGGVDAGRGAPHPPPALADGGASLAGGGAPVDAGVELLHSTAAIVAVSSRVKNDSDTPEHLVDGKLETAWNSRTGELRGAWVAFRVRPTARVRLLRLTAGYTRINQEGDLFTMNHRVRKVRIERDGKTLKEATLDVEKRTLQAIPLDAPGGDFRIVVTETVPGTKRRWRELCISELEAWGDPGGPIRRWAPELRVGSLDTPADGGPDEATDERCAETERKNRASKESCDKCGDEPGCCAEGHSYHECSTGPLDDLGPAPRPFLEAVLVQRLDPWSSSCGLAVKGRSWTEVDLGVCTPRGDSRPDTLVGRVSGRWQRLPQARPGHPGHRLVVEIDEVDWDPATEKTGAVKGRSQIVCEADIDAVVTCAKPVPLAVPAPTAPGPPVPAPKPTSPPPGR